MPKDANETALGAELVPWQWLRPHQQRDALWVVATPLDLEEVGAALTRDDAEAVRAWLANGSLSKPDKEQLDHWEKNPLQPLFMLIVQPFVLVQEQTLN
jgi:hypothetical protein